MFKYPNLGGNLTNVAEDLLKMEFRGVHGVRFFQVCVTCGMWHIEGGEDSVKISGP